MKISDLDETVVGKRIRVVKVAPSQAEQMGYVNDTERLTGQTGKAVYFNRSGVLDGFSQLRVQWDHEPPGSLMLAGNDEVEVL